MVDNFRAPIDLRVSLPDCSFLLLASLALQLAFLSTANVSAQTPSAAAAPSDAAASAGMTTGMSDTPSYRDLQLMQVRAAAQSAQGDAAAASMSRSADRSLEEQNRERAIQEARETKALKRDAANRMRWERSANAYNKISSNDMSTWRTETGNVRVERNVPDPFLISLIHEEEMLAARRAEEESESSGPLKKALGWRPFGGGDDSSSSGVTVATSSVSLPEEESGGGFFSKMRMPKLPSIGGGDDSAPVVNASNSEPNFAPSSVSSRSSAPPPSPAVSSTVKPGTVPRISGAELVDGNSQVQRNVGASAPAFAGTPPVSSPAPGAPALPGENEERGGLFSMLKSSGSSSSRSSGGGGLFSFGKKKVTSADGSIDAGLFPDNSVNERPTGGNLSGGYTVEDVSQDVSFASDTGSVELPGQEMEKTRTGFSLPKPSLSLPSLPKLEGSSGGGSGVPTNSVINSAGTNVYQVTETAQFMVYGEDRMQSEVRALQPGTIVRMTKAGDQWASIQLSDGTEGIIKNEFLRASQ